MSCIPTDGDDAVTRHLAKSPSAFEACTGLLFHGSLERLAGPLHGGVDGVFWTSEGSPIVAQTYIPASGTSIVLHMDDFDLDSRVRPDQGCMLTRIAVELMGRTAPFDVVRDPMGMATRFKATEDWPRKREVRAFIENEMGYAFDRGIVKIKSCGPGERLMRADESEIGTLLVLKPSAPLRILDVSCGDSDLADPQHRRIQLFSNAERAGYDAIRIDDFCQTEHWGNVGHRSLGLLPSGLDKVTGLGRPAIHREWDGDVGFGGVADVTPEFESLWSEARLALAGDLTSGERPAPGC